MCARIRGGRSRSREDEGIDAKKLVKTSIVKEEPGEDGLLQDGVEAEDEGLENGIQDDDPIVFGEFPAPKVNCLSSSICNAMLVNGQPKPFSHVTEEDQDLMTPEEYTAYFEVFQSRS